MPHKVKEKKTRYCNLNSVTKSRKGEYSAPHVPNNANKDISEKLADNCV